MTRQEVISTIRKYAGACGFELTEETIGLSNIQIQEKEGHTVNFIITERTKFTGDREVQITLKVRASIATMGGNPTADELMRQAQVIMNAGNLVKLLEDENLTYTETFDL